MAASSEGRSSKMRRRPACQWRLVTVLLAGFWLQNAPQPNFCGGTTDSRCLQRAPSRGRFASQVPRNVRERRRQAPAGNADDGEARRLTSRITKAGSASELLVLLGKPVDDAKLFNQFHMSAALTKLARFQKRRQCRQSDATSPVWAKLSARLQKMLQSDLLPPREAANVFYSVGELYEEVERHMTQVLPKLCRAVGAKARGMKAQEISNCLLAAVKLQDASPEVLDAAQALAKRIPDEVADMKPQELSNSLWAAARLQDASPEVLDAVPSLAKRIPNEVQNMKPQELSNSLWAAAKLQDASPEVLNAAPALAKRIPDKVEEMKPQELSNSLLAAAKLQDSAPEPLEAVPAIVRRMQDTVSEMNLQDLSDNFRAVAMLKDAPPDALALAPELIRHIQPGIRKLSLERLLVSLQAAQQLGEDDLADRLRAELDRRQC